MLKSLFAFWNKPYPAMESKRDNLLLAIAFGLFVFLFLWVFKPFEIMQEGRDSILILLGFGLVTTTIVLFNFFVLNILVEKLFLREIWKLKHTFYASLWNLSSIAIGNYLYMVLTTDLENTFLELFKVLYYTLVIGIFPVLIVLVYSEHRLLKTNELKANKTTSIIKKRESKPMKIIPENNRIRIKTDVVSDDFLLDLKELLFVKAEGNYSTFFMEGCLEETGVIKRISLKSVEEQLNNHPKIMRCHRSYIININKIKNVSGNARNISLHFDIQNITVPVSRAKEREILSSIGHLR